jgi:hypothetical protein
MKATALQYPDNSTQAHFAAWAWGSGSWPTPTTYGFSSFLYNAGFTQTGNTSTFTPSGGERSDIIGDGQVVFNNITFNVTNTQATGSVATYTFSGLSGGALRAGLYIASVSGTTNDGGAFNITIPTQIVVITGVSYTSTTSGTFTTAWTSGTQPSQGETGTGQITSTCSTFYLTSSQFLPSNNASIGSVANAAYGNTSTGQTTFKGYWITGTSYSVGDCVIWVSTGTGTSAVIGVFVCILATSSASPPTTNAPNTNWQQYTYELWETADSALPAYVQSAQQVSSVTFNPLAYPSPNTAGNTLVVFGRFTGGSGAPTIKDTNGNTWIQLFSNTNGSDTNVIWYAYNVSGATNTNYVTVSQPTQNTLQLAIAEYSGITTVSPLDQSTDTTGTSTSANSGNVTTTQANELLIGFIDNATANGLTVTPTGGYTARQTVNGNLVIMDQTVATTGSYAATATLSSSVAWFAAIATLKGTQLPAFYFKFEYGNYGSSNVPAMCFQIGTSITSTGALSQSGNRSYRELIQYSSATANSSTQFETDYYADGTSGLAGGKFAMIAFRNSSGNQSWLLAWERSKSNVGVDTPQYITYLIGQNSSTAFRQSSVFATAYGTNFAVRSAGTSANTGTLWSINVNSNSTSWQTVNSIAVGPVFPNVGYFGNPMTVAVGLALSDASEGVVFTTSIYNTNHNYLMTKESWTNYFSSAGSSAFAIRWE